MRKTSSAHPETIHAAKACTYESPKAGEQNILIPIQCKLTAGAAGDPLAANTIAGNRMHMPANNFIQRKCKHCEEEEKAQRKPLTTFIQKKETSGNNTVVTDSVTNQIASTRGSGNVLDNSTRSFMESRFNKDFSDVRIHSNNEAVSLSTHLNAQAFTVGNDIYFNTGKFSPGSPEGKKLLAHELTHVVQQAGTINPLVQRTPFGRRDPIHDTILDDFSRETGLPRDQVNTT